MLRQFTTILVLAASVVFAQSDDESPSPTSGESRSNLTSSAAVATHTVKVGYPLGQHAFVPDTLEANLGDTIVFEMFPANHSVVRMDADSPCIPYSLHHSGNQGWWSGFFPTQEVQKPKTWNITVDTKDPIWFYCSAPESCPHYEMVGVINPTNKGDLASVKKAAGEANFALSPGEKIPDEQSSAGKAPPPSDSKSESNSDSSSLSGGAIGGIVVGGVAVLALVGLLFFFVGRKKKAKELSSKNAAVTQAEAGESHPPMYQTPIDPRYSMVLPGSPAPDSTWTGDVGTVKTGHASYMSGHPETGNPNRLSELPSQNYDPVEIYTPDLPEQMEFLPMTPGLQEEHQGDRRDTY